MTATLGPGQPAPWFHAAELEGNPRYAFDTAAGRWIVLLFAGSGRSDQGRAALAHVAASRDLFDDARASFFGVTADPMDVAEGRIARRLPGVRWFLDYDHAVATLYGAAAAAGSDVVYAPHWLLLDPMLRVRMRARLSNGGAITQELRRVLADPAAPEQTAPVLIVPGVLEPTLCRRLIELYSEHGGTDSGFMRDENGVTVEKRDYHHKRRRDHYLEDGAVVDLLKRRLSGSLRPMILRAFQFDATRIERWMVACYDAADGGHFRAHRDNTTKGTAHRRFAVTVNLNAGEYEGGDLVFPEFGARRYRAPTGGAAVFSCSLLHEATPVTRGRRYAFLPFLYDDAGARVREGNLAHVAPELRNYRSGLPPL